MLLKSGNQYRKKRDRHFDFFSEITTYKYIREEKVVGMIVPPPLPKQPYPLILLSEFIGFPRVLCHDIIPSPAEILNSFVAFLIGKYDLMNEVLACI